jgi:hypothetical protein
MKDFLQGRPQSRTLRPAHSHDHQPTQFPPIPTQAFEAPQHEETPPPVNDTPPPIEPTPPVPHESKVETVLDAQGRIGHIVVNCRCGEQIIIQCNY